MMVEWEGNTDVGVYRLHQAITIKYEFEGWIRGDGKPNWIGFVKDENGMNAVVGREEGSCVVAI
jgi:hypothetical protein